MIPNDFIQTLLSRVDIVEVIDRYVPLKKAGANYVACCPFHSEKTPSFSVSPGKQFYHCFGCGAHGTAVGFLMEYGGKAFPDAVEELAFRTTERGKFRDATKAVQDLERLVARAALGTAGPRDRGTRSHGRRTAARSAPGRPRRRSPAAARRYRPGRRWPG